VRWAEGAAGRAIVEHPLGRGQPGADPATARAQRDRGPRSTLHVRGRDDQPGIDREKTNPEQPRDDGRLDEKPFRERPTVVGNRDQVRRR